jgi:hypothetical protein
VQVEFFRRSAVATAASGNGFAQCCSARRRNERKLVLFAFVDRTTSAASEMSSAHNLRRRPATGRMRWRNCVAWSLFVALAWPSLGLLPWVESDFAAADHVAAGHDARPETTHDHGASDIPGSPTHPADHNCFQCQVLKHLADASSSTSMHQWRLSHRVARFSRASGACRSARVRSPRFLRRAARRCLKPEAIRLAA